MAIETTTLLQKTGTTGTTGLNTNALPTSLTDDARGVECYMGNHYEQPMQVDYVKASQNLTVQLEATMDDGTFSLLSFYRLDTGALVDGTSGMTLTGSKTVLIEPFRCRGVSAIRPCAFLAGAGALGDTVKIHMLKGRS